MEGSGQYPPEEQPFEVSVSPETSAADEGFEGANVCRVAALSAMFGDDADVVRDLTPELEELGFSTELAAGELLWSGVDPREAFADFEPLRDGGYRSERVSLWQAVNESPRPGLATVFLVAALGSHLERESAAAACALWRRVARTGFTEYWPRERLWELADRVDRTLGADLADDAWRPLPWLADSAERGRAVLEGEREEWDPQRWTAIYERVLSAAGESDANFYIGGLLAGWRLGSALRSPDPVTSSLAAAAFVPAEPPTAPLTEGRGTAAAQPAGPRRSTMIHGTWAWQEAWWRPNPGSFHEFIRDNYRPRLYGRGGRFSWSGELDDSHRELAARDLSDWVADIAAGGIESAFAHSYGGEVAARAVLAGAGISELVLLSVPANRYVRAAARAPIRLVDVRVRVDPVLTLIPARQRIPRGHDLTRVSLGWRLDHGASHDERIWRSNNVAARAGL